MQYMELFSYSFIQNAFLAILLSSIAAGVVGSIIVSMRMVFLASSIAHAAYGGVGIALSTGLHVLPCTLLFSMLFGSCMAEVSYRSVKHKEIIIAVLWAFGMAFGILLMDITNPVTGDILGFLFGSVLTVSSQTLFYMTLLNGIILLTVWALYPYILAVAFDMSYSKTTAIPTRLMYHVIVLLIISTVVLLLYTVGLIIMLALITLPVGIGLFYARSLAMLMLLSTSICCVASILGLLLSWFFSLSSGASIVLVLTLLYACVYGFEMVRAKSKLAAPLS